MSIKRFHRPNCAKVGTCDCPYRLDYRPLGMSGPHKRIQFPTRKAAQEYEAATRVKAKRGEYVPPAKIPIFRTVAADWLREKEGLHPATLLEARTILKYLAPLDPLRLDQITVSVIERLRDDLLAADVLAPRTIARRMGILSAIFKTAMRKGFITSNPAALAQRPRNPVVEVDGASEEPGALRADEVLSSDEIARLVEAAEPGLWRTYITVAAATGMRSEEINALQWGDIELDAGRLFVRRSLSWTRDEGQVDAVRPRFWPTKTRAGTRTLPLAPELIPMLRAWKLACPPSKDDLVFCDEAGGPLRRSRVLQGGVFPACRRAGLRRCNVKTLRHSYASGLLAMGAPITMVQARMGHATAAVTLRVYSHFLPSTDHGEAERYAASFLKSAKPVARAGKRSAGDVQAR
ncbi:MAG: tyrosine-type recombinase/integrase [Sciscionella sp.]